MIARPALKIGIDCRMFSSKFTGIGRCNFELVKNIEILNNALPNPHQIILFFNEPEFHTYKAPKNFKKVLADAKHYSLREQIHFLKVLNKEKLDIMHFTHFNLPLFYRRPFTVTIHDLTLSFFPGQKMNQPHHRIAYHLIINNAVRRAKKIITVSKNTKKDLIDVLHVPPRKIKVIYNGIGPEFKPIQNPKILQPTLKKFHIGKPFLLYTGVWRNHKNLLRLIEAFEKVRNQYKLNFQLVITGKKDPFYPEITRLRTILQLEKNVIFTDLVDEKELVHLYNAATFYVFPSLYEGFGMPPLEAMKCGTPCLVANSSSIPEICGADNAIYFDPYSPDDIAKKVDLLYRDVNLQARLIENGIEHVKQFSWRKMAKETFNEILNNV